MPRWTMSLFLAIVVVTAGQLPAWSEKIAVVLSRPLAPYEAAMAGFDKQAPSKVQSFNMDASLKKGKQIMSGLSPAAFSLVVCIGSEALGTAEMYAPVQIPVVYTMVLDQYDLKRRKYGGVLMQVSLEDQFDRIVKILPNTSKIGVIYNPLYSQKTINQARTMVKKRNLILVPIAVDREGQVPMALNKLKLGKVDMIWSVVDKTMAQPEVVRQIIQFSLDAKLPWIGLSIYQVKAGALIAFSADFEDLGAQTAQLAKNVLKSGVTGKIESPRRVITYINRRIQKTLGLKISTQLDDINYIQ